MTGSLVGGLQGADARDLNGSHPSLGSHDRSAHWAWICSHIEAMFATRSIFSPFHPYDAIDASA